MSIVIYNCRRCKIGKRVEYSAGRQSNGYRSYPYRLDERGQCVFPGRSSCGPSDATCPQCGRDMQWHYLDARHVPEVKCDARCTSARGHKCDCSCGGKNHGAGWGQTA